VSVEQLQEKLKHSRTPFIRSQYIPKLSKLEMNNYNTEFLSNKNKDVSEPLDLFSEVSDQKQIKIRVEWEQKKRGLLFDSQTPVMH
jgi:hypothetical protein